MALNYASETNAFGFCDRCYFRYPLADLKYETKLRRRTGLRVCPECLDQEHPQDFLGEVDSTDPQALRDPRPDISQDESRRLSAWNPVGQPATSKLTAKVGQVTVTTA